MHVLEGPLVVGAIDHPVDVLHDLTEGFAETFGVIVLTSSRVIAPPPATFGPRAPTWKNKRFSRIAVIAPIVMPVENRICKMMLGIASSTPGIALMSTIWPSELITCDGGDDCECSTQCHSQRRGRDDQVAVIGEIHLGECLDADDRDGGEHDQRRTAEHRRGMDSTTLAIFGNRPSSIMITPAAATTQRL